MAGARSSMKIVHIAQYLNPGMGYQENILPSYQQSLGHEVVLLTSTFSSGFNKQRKFSAGESREQDFRVVRIPVWGELRDKFVLFRDLDQHLEDEAPDYIFHHMPTTASIATVSRYKRNHPDVFLAVDNHADLSISISNRCLRTLYYNVFWKTVIKQYDRWIDLYFGVTPARCLFLSEELGASASKIRLLPIGADTRNLELEHARRSFRQKHGLSDQTLLIIHGGKLTADKQSDRILEAFARIDHPDIRLILFGSLEDPRLKSLVAADSRILHLGWLNRPDTLETLAACDLGIWNTRHTTLLEDCVAVGLPLVLRYYGSTSHLIDDSGIYLYEGSVREIQDRLLLLIQHPNLLSDFRSGASRLKELISYAAVAAESVAYVTEIKPQPIHARFMSPAYNDPSYQHYRMIETN